MGCCEPRTCCGPDEPDGLDACMCGCFCLNGSSQVAVAICLTFMGYIFSLASLGDCAFVSVRETSPDNPILPGFEETRRLGYITFEKRDGTCYWYNEGTSYPEDQIQAYFELLGSDWQVGRIFLAAVCSLSWLGFMYTFSLCCTAQVRGIRYFLAFVHSIGLTLFQSLSFLVFGSNFCDEYSCQFDRSAGWSCGAASCYFVAGICFFCMRDYPGKERFEAQQQKNKDGAEDGAAGAAAVITASKDDQVEIDEEAPLDPEWPDELDVDPPEEEPAAAAAAAVGDEPVKAEATTLDDEAEGGDKGGDPDNEEVFGSAKMDPEEGGENPPPADEEEQVMGEKPAAVDTAEDGNGYEEEIVVEETTDADPRASSASAPHDEDSGAPVDESHDETPDLQKAFTVEHEA